MQADQDFTNGFVASLLIAGRIVAAQARIGRRFLRDAPHQRPPVIEETCYAGSTPHDRRHRSQRTWRHGFCR